MTHSERCSIEILKKHQFENRSQSDADQWSPDVVKLPTEYKYFTATQEPNCMNPNWCKGFLFEFKNIFED